MSAADPVTRRHPTISFAELRSIFTDLPETPVILRAFSFAGSCATYPVQACDPILDLPYQSRRLSGGCFDAEVVVVITLLHDIGLTPHGEGANRFEVDGASIAAAFEREQGFDDRRAQLVWDGVALHNARSIRLFRQTEVALSTRGIGIDFGTDDYYKNSCHPNAKECRGCHHLRNPTA